MDNVYIDKNTNKVNNIQYDVLFNYIELITYKKYFTFNQNNNQQIL